MEDRFVVPKVMRQEVNPFLEKKLLIANRNPAAAAEIEELMRQRDAIDARLKEIQRENSITAEEFGRLAREAREERAAALKLMTGE